jgi:hypothetical protein
MVTSASYNVLTPVPVLHPATRDITLDAAGNLYILELGQIQKVSLATGPAPAF